MLKISLEKGFFCNSQNDDVVPIFHGSTGIGFHIHAGEPSVNVVASDVSLALDIYSNVWARRSDNVGKLCRPIFKVTCIWVHSSEAQEWTIIDMHKNM